MRRTILPKKHKTTESNDLFRARLDRIIDLKHELGLLGVPAPVSSVRPRDFAVPGATRALQNED